MISYNNLTRKCSLTLRAHSHLRRTVSSTSSHQFLTTGNSILDYSKTHCELLQLFYRISLIQCKSKTINGDREITRAYSYTHIYMHMHFSLFLRFVNSIKNETETHMWETTSRLSDTVLNSLLNHQNPGIRIHAVKCLQVLATIFSRPDRKIRVRTGMNDSGSDVMINE